MCVLCLTLITQVSQAARAESAAAERTARSAASAALNQTVDALEKLPLSPSSQALAALHALVSASSAAEPALSLLSGDAPEVAAFLREASAWAAEQSDSLSLGASLSTEALDQAARFLLQGRELLSRLRWAAPSQTPTAPPTAADLAAYKALPGNSVSLGQAMLIARDFIGEGLRRVSPHPGTTTADAVFAIDAQTDDLSLTLWIPSRGGRVMLLENQRIAFTPVLTAQECLQKASDALEAQGYRGLTPVQFSQEEGVLTALFVYQEQGILIWPDRVQVRVRMDSGELIGLDARPYLAHHTPRRPRSPGLTESEARAFLVPGVQVSSVRLCLLTVGNTERLCWMFRLEQDASSFIQFLDGDTGHPLRLDKVTGEVIW